ncbi:hypothetical protein [Pseudomonas tohonis]|uniref:hypothetical protein n=1 Tax=Pseudomonas tohonis TaxID=2725477 RepID=UPI0021D999D1|nr:hypothetical protein [Pseudomonas tohonis]UXY50504.1 hypothetical protein N9L84_16110 [Pseudomonas tohonis]
MTLGMADIGKLFTLYMPAYMCEATRLDSGTLSLQFTGRANLDVITLHGMTLAELSSPLAIRQLSKVLNEEFAIAIANRRSFRPRTCGA